MYPILISFGSVTIHTYGFMIAIGFLAGVQVCKMLAERSGLVVHRVIDMTFWLILIGFIGARVLYIITAWDGFMKDPWEMIRVWNGGLVFYGFSHGGECCVRFWPAFGYLGSDKKIYKASLSLGDLVSCLGGAFLLF